MCFGSSQTSTSTMTPTPNAAVANAATSNLNTAAQMTSGTPNNTYGSQYSGELVSPLSAASRARSMLAPALPTTARVRPLPT